jgi:hypothetical protein
MRIGPEKKRPPYLPDGYTLGETPDPPAVILRREDGSEVAYFGERASVEEVERAAWEDRRGATTGDWGLLRQGRRGPRVRGEVPPGP